MGFTWAGDGLMGGYDTVTRAYKADLFHFATPGSVDANAPTRFGIVPSPIDNADTLYPQMLNVKAPIGFTEADFTDPRYPSRPALSAILVIASAGWFPDGYVPKPSEILALGDSKLNIYRATYYWSAATTNANFTFFEPNGRSFGVNGKWWAMVVPTWLTTLANVPPTLSTDRPALTMDPDTFCRAISFWTDRKPNPPVITSAPSAVVPPGGTYNLTYASADPDSSGSNDAQRANVDVQGLHVQYAPLPTVANPNPEWTELLYHVKGYSYLNYCKVVLNQSLYGSDNDPYELVDNLGFPIITGIKESDVPEGYAYLPGGDWQVRLRVADYGSPYPLLSRDPAKRYSSSWDGWPDWSKSDWSTPIKITVPSEVPPPIPLSPISNLAIQEGQAVRLSWQYRNTFVPPKSQFRKVVQIRKVGDTAWTTVCNALDANPYFDLPVNFIAPANPASEYLTNGGFEVNNLDGWTQFPSDAYSGSPPALPGYPVNQTTVPPGPKSGSRYLFSTPSAGYSGGTAVQPRNYGFRRLTDLLPAHDSVTVSGSYRVPSQTFPQIIFVSLTWVDANNVPCDTDSSHLGTWTVYGIRELATDETDVYRPFSLTVSKRPANAVRVDVGIAVSRDEAYPNNYETPVAIDDFSLFGFSEYPLSNFTLEATTQYEWRALTTDTAGEVSTFSDPARFWVVDASNSGAVIPLPSGTIEGGTLGCGKHRVEVYRRGGTKRTGELTAITYVDWSRVRDDISTAKVVLKDWDIDCGNLLKSLQTWAYELVIWRESPTGTERVWEGPLTLLTYENDTVTLEAKDVMGYLYRRILRQAMNDVKNGGKVTARAAQVIRNCFAPDDPNVLAYLQVLARDDDADEYRSTPAYSRTGFEEVDDMAANAGLDYTVIGRSILLWGTRHRIGTLPEFRDGDLGATPIVTEYGMEFANHYVVTDGNGIYGEASSLPVSGNDPDYGLVEILASTWSSDSSNETGTFTQAGITAAIESFEGYAERSLADRTPPPVVVRLPENTTLNPKAAISIQSLVPGVLIPLRSMGTLRDVVASQKLDTVKVVETDGKETITVSMSPFSRDDAAVEDDDEDA